MAGWLYPQWVECDGGTLRVLWEPRGGARQLSTEGGSKEAKR